MAQNVKQHARFAYNSALLLERERQNHFLLFSYERAICSTEFSSQKSILMDHNRGIGSYNQWSSDCYPLPKFVISEWTQQLQKCSKHFGERLSLGLAIAQSKPAKVQFSSRDKLCGWFQLGLLRHTWLRSSRIGLQLLCKERARQMLKMLLFWLDN